MKFNVLIVIILFVLSSFILAEKPEEPTQILKVGDVKHFIETFPQLKKDFEKFGIEYEAKSGMITYPDAIKASSEYLEILKKHGWDENYFTKAATIFLGYSTIVYSKEIKKVDPQIEKSIKEIESNPNLSDEMKKQLIEQMKAVKGIMKNQQASWKSRIHKSDMALIKPQIEELKKILEETKNN